jgi:hypothetical protein
MSYIVNKTDGNVLVTLLDGTTNTDTGLTLIGRNYTGYGLVQNENFVRLLENFADPLPPGQSVGFTPLVGTIWYDNANKFLKTFDGTNWQPVSQRIVSGTAPTATSTGDQWYDTANQQLNSWNGTAWQVIGPAYTAGQLKSGAVVETLTDTFSRTHTVVNTYTNNNLISITSYDATFTPNPAIAGITTINPGVNLVGSTTLNGNATNSLTVGNITPTSFARVDCDSVFTGNIGVAGTLALTNANIYVTGTNLNLRNNSFNGNIDVYVNTSIGLQNALHVNGTTGLVSVTNNPVTAFGIATKQYADNIGNGLQANISSVDNQLTTAITQLNSEFLANLSAMQTSTNSNLATAVTGINSNVSALSTALAANLVVINADFSSIANAFSVINSILSTLAPTSSPALTGSPTVPTVPLQSNSNVISSTAYVDGTASVLITNYTNQINAAATTAANNLASAMSTKANIDNPTFTGTPNAPTPTSGDNSTKIATTAFVTTAIQAQKFNYTVSVNPPSGGNDGDFWFQVS